jgi:ABC-2 type transport system ATP-binding protein
LAQSLIHDPEVLILDEPTDGLDPNQKHEVRQLIKRLGRDKVVIFSTHILEEVEAVCTRALIIDQGKVVADGTPDTLKAQANRAGSVRVNLTGAAGSTLRHALESLPGIGKLEVEAEKENGLVALLYPKSKSNSALANTVFELAKERGLKLHELRVDEGRLDEMFREITSQVKV